MNQNKEVLHSIVDQLDLLATDAQVEVLANLFIRVGIKGIKNLDADNVNTANIFNIVMDDVENNGETISNALVRQGLLLLSWIDKEKI